jgi:hypothetical protein
VGIIPKFEIGRDKLYNGCNRNINMDLCIIRMFMVPTSESVIMAMISIFHQRILRKFITSQLQKLQKPGRNLGNFEKNNVFLLMATL